MVALRTHHKSNRVCMLCDSGDVLVVEISSYGRSSLGSYSLLAELSPSQLASSGSPYGQIRIGRSSWSNSELVLLTNFSVAGTAEKFASQSSALGKLDACDGYLIVIALDGTARLYDVDAVIDSQSKAFQNLRCRRPFGSNDYFRTVQQSRTNNSTLTSTIGPADETDDDGEFSTSASLINSKELVSKVDKKTTASESSGRAQNASAVKADGSRRDGNRSLSSSRLSRPTLGTNSGVESSSKRGTEHVALFEFASLTPKEQRINEEKLKKFLQVHGKYSTQARIFIHWVFRWQVSTRADTVH